MSKKTVMVVNYNEVQQKALQSILTAANYVMAPDNIVIALDWIAEDKCDLILLDGDQSVVDLLDQIAKFRSTDKVAAVAMMIISYHPQSSFQLLIDKGYVSAYIRRPCTSEEILKKVAAAIEKFNSSKD